MTLVVAEAKISVLEEFGVAIVQDFQSVLKQFWQTVRSLRTQDTLSITGGKVTEVVKKLHCGLAPGVDELFPQVP